MVFRDKQLEEWILTALGSEIYGNLDPDRIIKEAPQTLVKKIPNASALVELLYTLESKEGLLTHSWLSFSLTLDGKLHYRKFLSPLSEISKDEQAYSRIVDSSQGDKKIKKGFKRLLKSIKDKEPDEANNEFRKFLYDLGKDAIWFTVRIIFELSH